MVDIFKQVILNPSSLTGPPERRDAVSVQAARPVQRHCTSYTRVQMIASCWSRRVAVRRTDIQGQRKEWRFEEERQSVTQPTAFPIEGGLPIVNVRHLSGKTENRENRRQGMRWTVGVRTKRRFSQHHRKKYSKGRRVVREDNSRGS